MNIFDLKVYNLAMEIGEKVWAIVDKWNYFEKDTVGKQLVRAVDSIAANLSDGFGRYHFNLKNYASHELKVHKLVHIRDYQCDIKCFVFKQNFCKIREIS